MHFVLGSMNGGEQDFLASSPLLVPALAVEVVIPRDPQDAGDCDDGTHRGSCAPWIARLQLTQPGRSTLTVTDAKAKALRVKVTKLEKKRGGRLELTLAGAAGDGPEWSAVARTFVRDVVSSRARLGISRFGDDGGMR